MTPAGPRCAVPAPISSESRPGRRRPGWPRQQADSGTALVEFALVLPIFALMLFAMVQFGLAFTGWAQLRNAVQTGARMASTDDLASAGNGCGVPGHYSPDTQQMVCEIENLIGSPVGTAGAAEVGLYLTDLSGAPPAPTEVVVCAKVPVQAFTGFFPTVTLSSVSTFYIEHLDPEWLTVVPGVNYNPYGLASCGPQT